MSASQALVEEASLAAFFEPGRNCFQVGHAERVA